MVAQRTGSSSSFDVEYPGAPLLPHVVEERRARACQHILAAYRLDDPIHVRSTSAAQTVQRALIFFSKLEWVALLTLVGLSIFERPVWCIQLQDTITTGYPCQTPMYPGWGHAFLGLWTAFTWEFCCLGVLFLFLCGHLFAGAPCPPLAMHPTP